MRQKLEIVLSEKSKVPYAKVPCDCIWELTEYLSFHRVTVIYDFKATHFTVTFPKLKAIRAQTLLDQWVQSPVEYAKAG